MTRFARAKGSKASNEKLPESATSWLEMKQDLLKRNTEIKEKQQREEALQRRNANYQAFLQEKENEEDKETKWADFDNGQLETNIKKRKLHNGQNKLILQKNTKKHLNNVKNVNKLEVNKHDLLSEDSDAELNALKSKIEVVLNNQNKQQTVIDESDSDAAPEEIVITKKPKEIVIKKAKRKKQKLQIIIQPEEPESSLNTNLNNIQNTAIENITENLSETEKRKIAKKQERYKKQLEKKKLKRKTEKLETKHNVKNSNEHNNLTVNKSKHSDHNKAEVNLEKLIKKKERRARQAEKRKLFSKSKEHEVNNDNKNKVNRNVSPIKNESKKSDNRELNEEDLKKLAKKKEKKAKQVEKRKKFKKTKEHEVNDNNKSNVNGNISINNNNLNHFDKKTGSSESVPSTKPFPNKHLMTNTFRNRDSNEHKRKKPLPETQFINGKSVDIDYVDGFPVKKEDADRLKNLRREMITKGLPRSEINAALKLERRRAEKALAREKKNVCFNCRKSGHVLSECPELGKGEVTQTAGTGICFKCGSTEHTHFECKVVRGMDYKFAQCFICNEQGHIARQCPDNQRGLYPKGGSCNVCGDVTHLKKDCPRYQQQQAQLRKSFNIESMNSSNPDALDNTNNNGNVPTTQRKPNKVIKF
ncbi:myb-like protein X [Sitophilus oryzae]|uniref:Myb-like protein X n=1 Tax=Sitophilus oryzae TaxID=7048 RepID=A0A6J2XMC1_SITOR|nr:myb-like protein X [Sitophilus oryzae]